jgi:hypothetical protein
MSSRQYERVCFLAGLFIAERPSARPRPDSKILNHPEHLIETHIINVARTNALKLRSGPKTRFRIVTAMLLTLRMSWPLMKIRSRMTNIGGALSCGGGSAVTPAVLICLNSTARFHDLDLAKALADFALPLILFISAPLRCRYMNNQDSNSCYQFVALPVAVTSAPCSR